MAIGAFFMPFISKRLLLPAAVGEIIYGIVIVSVLPHGENQLEMVEYFSALGFLILMYLAGLEIDFDRFRDFIIRHSAPAYKNRMMSFLKIIF